MSVRMIAPAAFLLSLLACRPAPSWAPASRPLWPELSVAVTVVPTEARAGDTIHIVATARNERGERVTVTFPDTCVLSADVFTLSGTLVTNYGCLDLETRVELEPREEIVRRFTVPGPSWRQVRPGRYRVYGRLGSPHLVRYSSPVELRVHK
jgi:hypothetical protein